MCAIDYLMVRWYAPKEITFTRDQIFFLIENLSLLKDGLYPPDYLGSGYTGGDRGSINTHAPFEMPCQFAAEIDSRLDSTGLFGKLLVAEITAGLQLWQLSSESKLALNYCSGWRRRRMTFLEWKKQSLYRQRRQNAGNYTGP